jgi:hypothetical protein
MLTPLRYDDGKITKLKMNQSSTITKFDALVFNGGYLERGVSTSTEVRFIALEDNVTGAGEYDEILVLPVKGVEFECDTDANMAQSYLGTQVDLTDHNSIAPATSTYDVFYITAMIGATTDKKCRGYFLEKFTAHP